MVIANEIATLEPPTAADLAMQICVWWGVYPDASGNDMGLAASMNDPMQKLDLAALEFLPSVAAAYD